MIHTDLIRPVPELLKRQAAELGPKTAYEDASRAVSYADLDRRTAALAASLAAAGIEPGQSVAIYLPNSVDWIEACFAIDRAGAVAVPINHASTEPEVHYRLIDADCRAIFTTADKADLCRRCEGDDRLLILDEGPDGLEDLVAAGAGRSPRDPDGIDDTAYIVYTSGTTGQPKGVCLSVRSMLWVTAACCATAFGLNREDRVLSPLPLFHSYALNFSVLSVLATGASEYILPRFSPEQILAKLAEGGFTVLPGVPTMFHYLLEAARDLETLPEGLRVCVSAGAIMPATLNQAFEERFGVTLLDGYGITETATFVTANWAEGGRILGSCGIPLIGQATRIVDPATGGDVEFGAEGELIVRGPNLMLGYLNKPEETAKAIRGGWYHTGDLARSDANGFLTITGRLKELIIRGGQNIAPAEIEEAAAGFPGLLDCAVAGAPHEHLGEVPVIYVVPRDRGFDADALLDHCRERLSSYKVPTAVHVVDSIPRTGSGKIMRYLLSPPD